jgi:hypothetical protein
MNIKEYAVIVLNMNNSQKKLQAIAKLQYGIKHEEKWDEVHKKEISRLISFLQSGSDNINDLEKYCPIS